MTGMRSAIGVCRDPYQTCPDCGWGREAGEDGPLVQHGCANPGRLTGWGIGSYVTARGVRCRVVRVHNDFLFGRRADLLYGPGRSLLGIAVDEITPALHGEDDGRGAA